MVQKKNKYVLYDNNGKVIIMSSHKGVVRKIAKEYSEYAKDKQPVFESSNIDTSEV